MVNFIHLQNWCSNFWFLLFVIQVITPSTIAYYVNNNLDEVFLAIVCALYNGYIITGSRLVPEVTVSRAFVALGSRVLVEETSWIAC